MRSIRYEINKMMVFAITSATDDQFPKGNIDTYNILKKVSIFTAMFS